MAGTRIAILGATSHIARGLIVSFARRPDYEMRLFARSPDRVSAFLKAEAPELGATPESIERFADGAYDVIVNCTGIGNPATLRSDPARIFAVTEALDEMILGYQQKNRDALSVHFSSGAVYGAASARPVTGNTVSQVDMNRFAPENSYAVAKMNSEAKHRTHSSLHIVDLRVFAYFSRYIDLDAPYFMTEVVNRLKAGRVFLTSSADMVRDYVHPADLAMLVERVMDRRRLNDVFDVYSRQPVGKFEILEHFRKTRGLEYRIDDAAVTPSPTGTKDVYYSGNRKANQLGYEPRHAALDCIVQEVEAILDGCPRPDLLGTT